MLKRFGQADLDRDYGNFDRCDVIVDTGDDEPVDVEVHFDTGGASDLPAPQRTEGAVRVVKEAEDSDACVRTLLPAGDPDVNISVVAKQDEGTAPLCPMADAAAATAVDVLNEGRIARRSPAPAHSLVHEDACALLDPKDLEAVPGVDAKDPDVSFGGWDCKWASTTGDLWLEVRFDRGQPPTGDDGILTRVGGRRAVVQPDAEGPRTCLVRVVHRTYTDPGGDDAVETVNVTVGGDPSDKKLRRLATSFAGKAEAELRADHPRLRELRERYGILELAKTPELCAEVTLMPIAALIIDPPPTATPRNTLCAPCTDLSQMPAWTGCAWWR